MEFPYKKIPLNKESLFFGQIISKPIIPVTISANGREVRYAALIDSGADFNIFDGAIGDYLGLDVRKGQKENFGGIQAGCKAEAFLHRVTLSVGGWDYKTTVGFSYDIAKYGHGVLGQKGFFNIFMVKFDYQKEKIELKEILRN